MELPVLSIPALPKLSFNFLASKPILLIVFVVFLILYSILSSVLLYHWSAYGMKSHGILVGKTLFLFVSFVLIVVSLLSITYI